jgi:hypothetical protein
MTELKKFYRKFSGGLCTVGLGLLLAAVVWGQVPAAAGQSAPTAQPSRQLAPTAAPDQSTAGQKNAGEGARATPGELTIEQKISPRDAEELFHQVDEILKFSSKDSELPIKHEVKRRLTNRDDLVAYTTKHMSDDEDAKRLRRSELVLKKFGLLPHEFDLGSFLVALLREQVAGYYDPKTKTVNLLDWVGLEQQRPVLAHELTHALQDQSFGLEKWMKAGAGDLVERRSEPTPADIENDEMSTARQAVVEGQAMAVLVDYMLAPSGHTLLDSPEVVEALKQGMLTGTADSPRFRDAPIFIKQELTFPYRYGLDFVAALLKNGGKAKAYAGAFTSPPHSSRQIMEPQAYLSGEHIEPMRLPDFKQDFKNYEKFDIGAMGEFDVAILIDQYAGDAASHALYPHWRGGYYYAVRPKGQPSSALGLLYVSRWSNAEKAAEFAAIYAKSLAKRYQHVHGRAEDGQKPMEEDDLDTLQSLSGKHTWLTEEGSVMIGVEGETVMITESLDGDTTKTLEGELFAAPTGANK